MLLFEAPSNFSGADVEIWNQRHDLSSIPWRIDSTLMLVMKTGLRGVVAFIVAFLAAFFVLWVVERSWAFLLERIREPSEAKRGR
jgi:hypothetical protein